VGQGLSNVYFYLILCWEEAMNMKKALVVILFLTCILPVSAIAGNFDGSRTLLCALIELYECASNEGCERTTAEAVNLPQFLTINVEKKQISGATAGGTDRKTAIERVERVNGRLILQGGEEGRGWSISINEQTGKMVGTVSGEEAGFVIFGACAVP
jgi:hypothetical protein